MSFVKRTIKIGKPFNEGEHVLAGRKFVDGEFLFAGPTNEADNLALYFKNAYEAIYVDSDATVGNEVDEDEDSDDEDEAQKDRKDTSGEPNVGGQAVVPEADADKGPVVGKPSEPTKTK